MAISLDKEKTIKDWFSRSLGQVVEFTVFDRFISLWFAFNSWGTYRSERDKDVDMLKWVKDERNSKLGDYFRQLLSNN